MLLLPFLLLPARADSSYRVTLQTGNLSGPSVWGLDFYLQNGEAANPLRATIQNFQITGGALSGDGVPIIGSRFVSGSVASLLTLATINGGDYSELVQNFTVASPNSVMTFDLNLSSDMPQSASDDPDFFSFRLLDGTGTPLFTGSPDDNVSVVYAAFDRVSPVAQGYDTEDPLVPVQLSVAASAPEPTSFAYFLPAFCFGTAFRGYKRREKDANVCYHKV